MEGTGVVTTDLEDRVRQVHEKIARRVLQIPDSISSTYLGPGEDTGVEVGSSAGDASSGEGVSLSEPSSSEVFGDGVCEGLVSSGDALDGEGTSGGVGSEASLGRTFAISCRRMVWK